TLPQLADARTCGTLIEIVGDRNGLLLDGYGKIDAKFLLDVLDEVGGAGLHLGEAHVAQVLLAEELLTTAPDTPELGLHVADGFARLPNRFVGVGHRFFELVSPAFEQLPGIACLLEAAAGCLDGGVELGHQATPLLGAVTQLADFPTRTIEVAREIFMLVARLKGMNVGLVQSGGRLAGFVIGDFEGGSCLFYLGRRGIEPGSGDLYSLFESPDLIEDVAAITKSLVATFLELGSAIDGRFELIGCAIGELLEVVHPSPRLRKRGL